MTYFTTIAVLSGLLAMAAASLSDQRELILKELLHTQGESSDVDYLTELADFVSEQRIGSHLSGLKEMMEKASMEQYLAKQQQDYDNCTGE